MQLHIVNAAAGAGEVGKAGFVTPDQREDWTTQTGNGY